MEIDKSSGCSALVSLGLAAPESKVTKVVPIQHTAIALQ